MRSAPPAGKTTDELALEVDVELPSIDFGFLAEGISLDAAGRVAVVWGGQMVTDDEQRERGRLTANQYALIDLEKQQVIAQQRLTAEIRSAAVDDKYLYLAPAAGNVLYRVSLAKGSERQRLFVKAPPQQVFPLPQGKIAVYSAGSSERGSAQFEVFDRETLKPVTAHPANRSGYMGHDFDEASRLILPQPHGVTEIFEHVADAKTGEIRCFIQPLPLLQLMNIDDAPFRHFANPPFPDYTYESGLRSWGRRWSNGSLRNSLNTPIANWRPLRTVASSSSPILFSLLWRGAGEQHVALVLEQRDMLLGGVVRSSQLKISPSHTVDEFDLNRYRPYTHLQTAGDRIVVIDENRAYVSQLDPQLVKGSLPLHLEFPAIPIAAHRSACDLQAGVARRHWRKAVLRAGRV